MNDLLWIIPALPMAGFLFLALRGQRCSRSVVAGVGAGSVTLSALLTFILGISFLASPPASGHLVQNLWTWIDVEEFQPKITFFLDGLSLVFVFVITFVGALIHIYSVGFMADDKDYARFFACMNLFVSSMLVLVLADNLLFLYLGWEGVGLCSYLLIGFWYENPVNGDAARKAFIITRIGDTALAIGLFLLFYQFGTLTIPDILQGAPLKWHLDHPMATTAAMLILAGGVGKSAQLPLQTWLPDAMAGPSPVSALIHAATMVTAGVYLIARMHIIFILSPTTQLVIAIVGGLTLLMAGVSALTQVDIKRVLAYSTISQIGYMFLALGVGAWTAAIFHFMVHAFFKALLFLAAGVIIESLHHEHNIFKMGGLKNKLPVVFWTFLIGAASLAALPLITAGFFSKDEIIWYAWSSNLGTPLFWGMALLGSFITALYSTRLVILVFWGESRTPVSQLPGKIMMLPILVLAFFSIVAGYVELPQNLSSLSPFSNLLRPALPETLLKSSAPSELLFQLLAALASLGGIYAGYLIYYQSSTRVLALKQAGFADRIYAFFLTGWGFDRLYKTIFVDPLVWIARTNKQDWIDFIYRGIAWINLQLNRLLSTTQSGSLRWYLLVLVAGAILILSLQIIL